MYLWTILATLLLLVIGYMYFFQVKDKFRVKKRPFDSSARTHNFVEIGENIVDHCAVGSV